MKYESGSSAESGCSRSDGPTDAEAERSRSVLIALIGAEIAYWHMTKEQHRCSPETCQIVIEALASAMKKILCEVLDEQAPPPT